MNTKILALAAAAGLTLSFAAKADDWPQWRGPNRDDVSKEKGLLQSWPAGGPKRIWLYENAGQGYGGPAVVDGKLFIMGTRGDNEALVALEANSGKELWSAEIGPMLDNDWGDGPRGTPTVDDGRVYALGGQGTLICASTSDGKLIWKRTMQELGGKRPGWGFTESVLVDGNKVVCTPGGPQGTIAALDKSTGKLLWQSKEFTDGAQYASIIPVEHNGVRQYIQLTMDHVAGVAAADGKLLWQSPWPGRTAVIPTPIFNDGCVYVTSGYGVGCKLIKLEPGHKVSEVYENKVMKNHHGGVVLVNGHLYGHSDRVGWVCQDFKGGDEIWSERNLGKGAITYADNRLYCLEEDSGTLALVEASPKGWKEHGRLTLDPQTKIRSGRGKIWTHPVIANGKLYLRDQDLLFCYDVQAN